MIHATAWSDCRQFEIEFDATLWAEQASDEAIVALGKCDFRGDYPADAVVEFMAAKGNKRAEALFEFLKVVQYQLNGDTNGFECCVDSEDLFAWLEANKPHLISEVFGSNLPSNLTQTAKACAATRRMTAREIEAAIEWSEQAAADCEEAENAAGQNNKLENKHD